MSKRLHNQVNFYHCELHARHRYPCLVLVLFTSGNCHSILHGISPMYVYIIEGVMITDEEE